MSATAAIIATTSPNDIICDTEKVAVGVAVEGGQGWAPTLPFFAADMNL